MVVEELREDLHRRLADLEELDRSNTGRGHDRYHRYLLELGLRSTRDSIAWAEEVLDDL